MLPPTAELLAWLALSCAGKDKVCFPGRGSGGLVVSWLPMNLLFASVTV